MSEPLEHLPYYREYLEQILRPRVVKLIDEVRAGLAAQVWEQILERMAEDQNGSTDAAAIQKMRTLLEHTLGLKLDIELHGEFSGAAPAANGRAADVVDRNFPDNPLARAVGGIRRPIR